MWKKSFAIFSVLCMLLTLCACGNQKVETQAEQETPKVVKYSFYDALDREFIIEKGTTRAAAMLGSFADIWQLAGGEVCATCDDAWVDLGLKLPNAINLGKLHEPNVEVLIESKPDIVLASASLASNLELRETLEEVGINVAYFEVNSFMDYLDMLAICTKITDKPELYEKYGKEIKVFVDELKDNFDGKFNSYEEKTYLLLRASGGYIRAKKSENTVLGSMLSELGYVNIADGDDKLLQELNLESVIEKNPYRIFIVQAGDDEEAMRNNMAQMMSENPAWNELAAVKANRIHYMNKQLFNLKPNARWGEAYGILCKILED